MRLTWGNHDYKTLCGRPFESYDRMGLSHALFASFLGPTALPYSARRVGRYNLLMLNGGFFPSCFFFSFLLKRGWVSYEDTGCSCSTVGAV